ncbi:hypothetical protein KFK09_025910 [Dendrobium nobile]|uniref:Uncharacterized protein n=1 Tax=Dendrobium nobile TaxID=94219 RepID=A0A8T3A5Z1_DENNO|nr:hypothetical protein KFK09_025910 [Dendrobium nobile]
MGPAAPRGGNLVWEQLDGFQIGCMMSVVENGEKEDGEEEVSPAAKGGVVADGLDGLGRRVLGKTRKSGMTGISHESRTLPMTGIGLLSTYKSLLLFVLIMRRN